MTINRVLIAGLLLRALAVPLSADPLPQPQLEVEDLGDDSWQANWEGVALRTYFLQWSLDLESWKYAPIVAFGNGSQEAIVEMDGAAKIYIRLRYADASGVDTLQKAKDADFDGDGIPNLYEVQSLSTDPLDPQSSGGDSDSDGMADGWELYYFGNLTKNGSGDADGDGFTEAEESYLGSNPTSASFADHPAMERYSYDDVGRLIGVEGGKTQSFEYDEEGNIELAQ